MAQLVVRQMEDDLKVRLQRQAKRNGRSMEAEVREILRSALSAKGPPTAKLGSIIAARFRGVGLTEDHPELRGQAARAGVARR